MANTVACPFCGFESNGEYAIQLHIEEHHTDDSPFTVKDATPAPTNEARTRDGLRSDGKGRSSSAGKSGSSSDEFMPGDMWTKCTRSGCGEYVPLTGIDEHLELHEAEKLADEEAESKGDGPPRNGQEAQASLLPKASRDQRMANSTASEKRSKGNSNSGRRTPPCQGSPTDEVHRNPKKLQKSHKQEDFSTRIPRSILGYITGSSHHGQPQRSPRRKPPPLREPGRLGRHELGPFAFEKQMPADVRHRLLNDAVPYVRQVIGKDGRLRRETVVENETSGIIRVLADVCDLDRSTKVTYLCDEAVKHVYKIRCDGNFCGYWSIQMVVSFLQSRQPNTNRPKELPHVIQIQETIESAWDRGICPYGRIETGGVRNTRKWIGSGEAVAYFTQCGVSVEALTFQEDDSKDSIPAFMALLDHVEAYFMSGLDVAWTRGTSRITTLAPIYFQRFGHSMTIVGLERKYDGTRNLLVFDSSFSTSDAMRRLAANKSRYVHVASLLRPYRRSELSLSHYEEFEIVVPQPKAAVKGGEEGM